MDRFKIFLQANKELANSEFELMKMGVEGYPSLLEYLDENIPEFGKIGFDGQCYSVTGYKELSENMGARVLVSDLDYISKIWEDRPALPKDKVWIHEEKYSGQSLSEKLSILREKIQNQGYDYTFIGSPEDICYLLNIRGNDVDYNPVVLSYMLISEEKAYLCIDEDKLDSDVKSYLEENGITIYSYGYIYQLLKNIEGKNRIYLDPNRTNVSIYDSINANVKIGQGTNFTTYMKAIKTDKEIENIKRPISTMG